MIDRYADVLPRAFGEQAMALRSNAAFGTPPDSSRASRALVATQLAMTDAIGKMYSDQYFPPEQKARVRAIVTNVSAAFARRVQAVPWMSPDTRKLALGKLQTLYVGIGYPDQWQDYTDLVVDPADALGNLRRTEARSYRRAIARIGRAIDSKEWMMAPYTPGALLVFQLNAYDFSAALLQPPKFDPAASDAATYGAIGALIGHDVSHFIDVLGADYDVNGAMRHWWSGEDMLRFQAAAEPLVAQFSSYRPFPDMSVDGKLTRTENVADLAGLTAAFNAYRRALGSRARDKAVREAAGSRVLHCVGAKLLHQVERGRVARAARGRSCTRAIPHGDGSQSGRVVRCVRRASGAGLVRRAESASENMVAPELATMRVTACELPHESAQLDDAWDRLCEHTERHATELVLLPELAMVEPVWEWERFDSARWAAIRALSECWLERLGELNATYVVGTRPVSDARGRFNEGFLWCAEFGVRALRRKCYLPDEARYWETQWFDRGDALFPRFQAGALSFGLNICTELWALDSFGGYAESGVQVILSPRATETATMGKWLSVGVVAAVRSGAYSVSSNRVDPAGTCGGMGWVISPDGEILAVTTPKTPFVTVDVDLAAPSRARKRYPCYVFESQADELAQAGDD